MASQGSYTWWRENFKTNADFISTCNELGKYGVDCSNVEVDHFPPNAAYSGTQFENSLSYDDRPAFPLPKYLHRFKKGGGGMGGHASTTGLTYVSKIWTPQLKSHMNAGDFFGAMKQDIIDKKNVALFATDGRNRHLFDKLMVPGVKLVYELDMISETQYYDILNQLSYWG